jgi:hypothetical protein
MPKTLTEIRSLARSHTRSALNVLIVVMRNTKAAAPARISRHAVLVQIHRVGLISSWHLSKKAVTPLIPLALPFGQNRKSAVYGSLPVGIFSFRPNDRPSTADKSKREGTSRS